MRWLGWLLAAFGLMAQDRPPVAIVRGELLERDGSESAGELVIRTPRDFRVERCHFDKDTYVARGQSRIEISALTPGDSVELVADWNRKPGKCVALTVYLVESRPPPVKPASLKDIMSGYRRNLDSILPRGNLTFAGIVLRRDPGRLLLKTRTEGRQAIVLREDTRYAEGGRAVDGANLTVNTTVFIRAGRNFENEIEAYQVIWGEILTPR